MIKYSKQRESIYRCLAERHDHPTAEMVYVSIKEDFPHISLGTVYRNLSLLADLGRIQKLSTGIGPDRFDGNPMPHYHFQCNDCGRVMDIEMENVEELNEAASKRFEGKIVGHQVTFYGHCPYCLTKE